jgi:glycosyl transferase family 4
MRVLLTNVRLKMRAGSQLYLLDVARWLRDHGHEPVAYSALLGTFADEIRNESIATIDDLRLMAEQPDVIHGQHHLPTMTAITYFPGVPVVAYCHGWMPWEELPLRHPAIRRYVAVSEHTRQRLTLEGGIDPARVRVIPNFVDTARFLPRPLLPPRPRRALIFSNYAARGSAWVEAVAAACAARGIELTVGGASWGATVEQPGEYLHGFDIVFAKARAALEAMATGAAVVLCDYAGLGPLVGVDNFAELRDGNFGMRVLRQAHTQDAIEAALDGYDPASARAVMDNVRDTLSRDLLAPEILRLYEEAISDTQADPTNEGAAADAVAAYLHQLDRLDPAPSGPLRDQLEKAHQLRREAGAEHERQLRIILREFEAAHHVDESAALRSQLAASGAELETMRNSTSWRVTAPLRRLGGVVRRIIRRQGSGSQ